MKMKVNTAKYGKLSLIWLLIIVMLMGTFAACDPGDLPADTSADEVTTTEPTETDPIETNPVDTDPVETDPVETEGSHSLSTVAATEATCTADGNIAYWSCSHCDKLFGDAEGKNEVTVESIVVPAKGHTEVIDEAVVPTYENTGLTEGKHCSVCHAVLQEQQEVPVLQPTYHAIVYKNLMGAESPEPTTFAEHLGLWDLPEITVKGYIFKGWYTKSEGGEKIEYIPKGTTDAVALCAQWEKIPYNIHYVNASVHMNPTTYTIEDTIYLNDPQWSGLAFVNWTDENGQVVTKLPKGTTGDMVLTANWTTYRNRVLTKDNTDLLTTYDEEQGRYHFICELGMISDVVVDNIVETYKKTTNAPYSMSISQTIEVQKTVSQSIACMAAQAVMNSNEFSSVVEKSHTDTDSWNIQATSETKFNIKAIKEKIILNGGYQSTTTDLKSTIDTETKVVSTTNTTSMETASVISYMTQLSTTSETSIDIPGDMPNGTYAWVHAVNIRIYAIITYDIEEDCYYLETYSIMDDMHTMLMYYASEYEVGSYSEPMAYNVPCSTINDFLSSVYFVVFDSGMDDASFSVLSVGKEEQLPANSFVRDEYDFVGWSLSPDGEVTYSDGEFVNNLAFGGDTITLYAVWKIKQFTLSWTDCAEYSVQVVRTSSPYSEASIGSLARGSLIYHGDLLTITYVANSGYNFSGNNVATIVVTGDIDATNINNIYGFKIVQNITGFRDNPQLIEYNIGKCVTFSIDLWNYFDLRALEGRNLSISASCIGRTPEGDCKASMTIYSASELTGSLNDANYLENLSDEKKIKEGKTVVLEVNRKTQSASYFQDNRYIIIAFSADMGGVVDYFKNDWYMSDLSVTLSWN